LIASHKLISLHYQITDNVDFLKASYSFCQYCMWHNQIVARQNLFLHSNICLLINIGPFHVVSWNGIKWAQRSCHNFKHFPKWIVGNLASTSCHSTSVMVISLNHLTLMLSCILTKINKSHGCKSDEYRGCEMMVILFLARNLQTETQPASRFWHKFDSNVMHFQVLFPDLLSWPTWHMQDVSNLRNSNSCVLEDKFLHLFHIFITVAHWWTSPALRILNWHHITFELGKPFKSLCYSKCLHSKSGLKLFRSFPSFSSQCNVKSVVDLLFFQVCCFLGMPESQMWQHTLVFKKDITPQSHILHPYFKQEMTQQTLPCQHLVVDFCANSGSLNLLSVQKLFDCIMYRKMTIWSEIQITVRHWQTRSLKVFILCTN
jgi:hypothetical protein